MNTLYFYTSKNNFGYRTSTFDWKVGEKIFSQDMTSRQTIIRALPATPAYLSLAKRIMDKVRRYAGNGQSKLVVTDNGIAVLAKVWKDGTGKEFFLEAVKSIIG